jgi:glucose-6-phosphate 1-dehydrogenase
LPFVIRAGKRLATTVTEVRATLKAPSHGLFDSEAEGHANEIRFRLSPDVSITLTARVKTPGEAMTGDDVVMVEQADLGEAMRPYERLLGDAMRGERTLFGSQAGVEASWRIVDSVLNSDEAPTIYEPGSWGP